MRAEIRLADDEIMACLPVLRQSRSNLVEAEFGLLRLVLGDVLFIRLGSSAGVCQKSGKANLTLPD
jgi:hypothetical protein